MWSCKTSGTKNENLPPISPRVPVGNEVGYARVDVFSGVAFKAAILYILYGIHQSHHFFGNVVLLLDPENENAALGIRQRRDRVHELANSITTVSCWELPLVLQVAVFMAFLGNQLFHVPRVQVSETLPKDCCHVREGISGSHCPRRSST
jgi:hypothetical protein